jgi:hypothetical protein
MLPVRKNGEPGKEVPPEESKNEPEKKGRSAARNCLEKTLDLPRTEWNASDRCRLKVEDTPMPLCMAG